LHKATFHPNCMCFESNPPLNHDQTFKWNSSHYNGGSIISIHKPHFMSSILWNSCNTLFPTLIWSYNYKWMWNSNPWHEMHPRPSPRLGCSLIRHGKCF
jgi:hypothetical protein